MKFEVKNRWSGEVQFTAEIKCAEDESIDVKLGLAVKWAVEAKADLRSANLRSANLRSADLRNANLRNADLRNADLSGANLNRADLRGASLSGADLRNANLRNADLSGANLPPLTAAQTLITPDGDLIGWKTLAGDVICKLRIPADAKRHNATGRKCRAEFAVVLEGEGVSQHDSSFHYRVGETVRPSEPFNENRWEECTSGVHFYLTRIEAENN